jgi:hypothetical protein
MPGRDGSYSMMRSALQSWFKKSLAALLWLAGVAMIVAYAPPGYQAIDLDEGEQVVAFLGKSHELVTLGRTKADPEADDPWLLGQRKTAKFRPGMFGLFSFLGPCLSPAGEVYVRDLDRNTRRRVTAQTLRLISAVLPCADSSRLCIEHGDGCRNLSIIDVATGKSLRTVAMTDFDWTISNDGRRLAFTERNGDEGTLKCIDVDDGRVLYKTAVGYEGGGVLSPDGKYLAIRRSTGGRFIDIDRQRPVTEMNTGWPEARDSRGFMDLGNKIWDPPLYTVALVERGKKAARVYQAIDGTRVRFFEANAQEALVGEARLAGQITAIPRIQPADPDGNFVLFEGSKGPDAGRLYAILARLGYEIESDSSPAWALIDARSSEVIYQGIDPLLGVSADGRYFIRRDARRGRVKIYERPPRRSLWFIAIAGGTWTTLAMTAPRWWRKRVSGEADEAEETHVHLFQAAMADTPW